ncbi:MAG: ROK family protein [Vampirovibrionales bacterium]|nr:ROK family protein [Vampirovibrionales bacterium]
MTIFPNAAIGIDIGGTKLLAGLMIWPSETSQRPEIVAREQVATPRTTPEFFLALHGLIDVMQANASEQGFSLPIAAPLAVGLSSAGMIHPTTTDILGSTGNMPALKGVKSYAKGLHWAQSQWSSVPLVAMNDATAAAFGEYAVWSDYVGDKKPEDMLMITLGTGIGGGLIVNGQPYHGATGGAMEVGHISLDPRSNRRCTCGLTGCWEAYASGTGLHATLTKALADAAHETAEPETPLLQRFHAGEAVTTYHLMDAVKAQDPLALSILDTWHRHLAQGLATLITVLNPGHVVIGGGLGEAVNEAQLMALVRERTFMPLPTVAVAQFGNDAGMVGAALLARLAASPSAVASLVVV